MKESDNFNDVIVRKLTSDELFVLTALHDYEDAEAMIIANKKRIENSEIDIFCLFDGEKLIGEIRVMYIHEDRNFAVKGKRAYLYAFRIHKDFQRKGFGKYLMHYVLELLNKEGYTEFTIGVEDDNEKAKSIYAGFGFNEFLLRKEEEYQGDKYEYNLYLKR